MSANRTEITPKQRKAIEALLTTGTVEQAAQAASVARDTLYRWMKDDVFVTALREAEAAALVSLSRSLVGLGDKATEALRAALDDEKTTIKLRAAEIVLGNLLRLRELVDIETRLAALEGNYASGQQNQAD